MGEYEVYALIRQGIPEGDIAQNSADKNRIKSPCKRSDLPTTQLLCNKSNQSAKQGKKGHIIARIAIDIQQLPQLIRALPESALKSETEKLAYQAYQAQQSPWQGTALFEAWAKFKHLQQIESPAVLKPFYPQ